MSIEHDPLRKRFMTQVLSVVDAASGVTYAARQKPVDLRAAGNRIANLYDIMGLSLPNDPDLLHRTNQQKVSMCPLDYREHSHIR